MPSRPRHRAAFMIVNVIAAGVLSAAPAKSVRNVILFLSERPIAQQPPSPIHSPGTEEAVTYRARGTGSTGPNGSACSYVAPVRTFQLTKDLVSEYQFYLTIGTLDKIRARFETLKKAQ